MVAPLPRDIPKQVSFWQMHVVTEARAQCAGCGGGAAGQASATTSCLPKYSAGAQAIARKIGRSMSAQRREARA
eukprot:8869088-Pyramimonas_sp.AAC.1